MTFSFAWQSKKHQGPNREADEDYIKNTPECHEIAPPLNPNVREELEGICKSESNLRK